MEAINSANPQKIKSIFHNIIRDFIKMSPHKVSEETLTKNYEKLFPSTSFISRLESFLSPLISKILEGRNLKKLESYFSQKEFNNQDLTKVNFVIQGSLQLSKSELDPEEAPVKGKKRKPEGRKSKVLEPIQVLGCDPEEVPLEVIDRILSLCKSRNAVKISKLVPEFDTEFGISFVLHISTSKGINEEIMLNLTLSPYASVLRDKAKLQSTLDDSEAISESVMDNLKGTGNLLDSLKSLLSVLGKAKKVDVKKIEKVKACRYALLLVGTRFANYRQFIADCSNVIPGKFFRYNNSGESLAFLFSVADAARIYELAISVLKSILTAQEFKNYASLKNLNALMAGEGVNAPDDEESQSTFAKDLRNKILTSFEVVLNHQVKPQLYNLFYTGVESYKQSSHSDDAWSVTYGDDVDPTDINAQISVPEKEKSNSNYSESLTLVEKDRAEAPKTIAKHADPSFVDKESTLTAIMSTIVSVDLIYFISLRLKESEIDVYITPPMESISTGFNLITEEFKELVASYFSGSK